MAQNSASNTDLVSIIMPNYNCARFLRQTLDCLVAQTHTSFELLFVDDCSTDNSVEIVQSYNDERFKIFVNPHNSGAAVSRNLALKEAKGKWIAFLDSDDIWLPTKLECQLEFMRANGYSFSYTYYSVINEDGDDTGVVITAPKRVTRRKMFNYCYMGCLTVMYSADVIGLIQIADLKKRNDYAMWLKASRKATAHCLNEVLARYRHRQGGLSRSKKTSLIVHHYNLFRVGEGMCVVRAVWHTLVNLFFGVFKKLVYVKRVKGDRK